MSGGAGKAGGVTLKEWRELLDAAKVLFGDGDHDPYCRSVKKAEDADDRCDCGMSRLEAAIRKAEGRE